MLLSLGLNGLPGSCANQTTERKNGNNTCLTELNELKFFAWNSNTNRCWKFQLSFLINKKVLFLRNYNLGHSLYSFKRKITTLLWRSQDLKWCIEKQKCPLSSTFVLWCAKIGSKANKLQKNVKTNIFNCLTFFFSFWSVWTFFVLGPILTPQTTKFWLSG